MKHVLILNNQYALLVVDCDSEGRITEDSCVSRIDKACIPNAEKGKVYQYSVPMDYWSLNMSELRAINKGLEIYPKH
jgi:hypothetical protein